jgi:hypothetical protein
MGHSTTPNTTTSTFIVRFWREQAGAESRWRGRIEHVPSGQRANFLAVEDLLGFFQRFGIGLAARAVGRIDDDQRAEDG